jgi:hypothetical protein
LTHFCNSTTYHSEQARIEINNFIETTRKETILFLEDTKSLILFQIDDTVQHQLKLIKEHQPEQQQTVNQLDTNSSSNLSLPKDHAPIQRNKCWPNIDPSTIRNFKPHNPWDISDNPEISNTHQKTNENNHKNACNPENTSNSKSTNRVTWGKYGPTNKNQQFGARELPQVLTMKLVINVKIHYTTAEESCVWYYRLKSAVHPYGILLIPVEEFEPEKSLCPTTYYGLTIDPTHYTLMSHALYHLLDQDDTIPRECTEVVNIVKKHASRTNGYAALYDIMAQIHPLLNPDAPFPAPSSRNCADVHEYYSQVESYFLHNKLEQNYLTPRKKVQIFLNGLDDSYAAAIRIITQKLKEWPPDQHDPPRFLELDGLPKKIDDTSYMLHCVCVSDT